MLGLLLPRGLCRSSFLLDQILSAQVLRQYGLLRETRKPSLEVASTTLATFSPEIVHFVCDSEQSKLDANMNHAVDQIYASRVI